MLVREEFNPEKTFGCGQTYHYWLDGDLWITTLDGHEVRVRETPEGVEISTDAPTKRVREFLGLDDPLHEIYREITVDGLMERVVEDCRGLRLMRDDFFACLISFVLSTQSTVERTTGLVRRLCEAYGEGVGEAYTFPSPETLAGLTEDDLRGLGVGYRAPYVLETARMIVDGAVRETDLRRMDYREAHEELQKLSGVGPKVADCVLLCSLGHLGVVALDTRINNVIDAHYPELRGDSYGETARNFRERFGAYTGYAQTYLYEWWG